MCSAQNSVPRPPVMWKRLTTYLQLTLPYILISHANEDLSSDDDALQTHKGRRLGYFLGYWKYKRFWFRIAFSGKFSRHAGSTVFSTRFSYCTRVYIWKETCLNIILNWKNTFHNRYVDICERKFELCYIKQIFKLGYIGHLNSKTHG